MGVEPSLSTPFPLRPNAPVFWREHLGGFGGKKTRTASVEGLGYGGGGQSSNTLNELIKTSLNVVNIVFNSADIVAIGHRLGF